MVTDIETTQPEATATTHEPAQPGAIQRGYCRLHHGALPTRYPVQPRPDLTLRRPLVVATRPGEELLCGCEHDGPHLWPDGDESGEWPDEPTPQGQD
ncbi:MAG: hypothetical protein WEC79_04595 [Thermomicrobiales bacterium]